MLPKSDEKRFVKAATLTCAQQCSTASALFLARLQKTLQMC